MYGLTGLEKISGGTITLDGQDITHASIRQRSKDGMSHIPEDRHKYGLVLDYTLEKNMVLQRYWQPQFQHNGFIKADEVRKYSDHLIEQYDVRSGQGSVTIARSMSGGNQQKVIIGRWLLTNPDFLILDEPTRGIDVGTKTEIQKLVVKLAEQGMAVVFISSEIEEMLRTCDRMVVMRDGAKVGELSEDEMNQSNIMSTIAGGQ